MLFHPYSSQTINTYKEFWCSRNYITFQQPNYCMLLPFKVYPVLLYTVYSECVVSQNYIMIFVWSQFFFHNDNVVFTYNIIVNGYHLWQYKKGNAFWKDCRFSFRILSGNFGTQLPVPTYGLKYVILNIDVKTVLVWLDKCWFS